MSILGMLGFEETTTWSRRLCEEVVNLQYLCGGTRLPAATGLKCSTQGHDTSKKGRVAISSYESVTICN